MNIKWESQGDGSPLLLIQGLGYGRWGWEPIVPGLAARHRVITFDNRGIGESDKPDGPYTAAQMAGDALQVLDEAGIDRAHVLGASLGGMIAQELAVRAPERVAKLILCCTTPGGPATVPMPEVTMRLFAEAPSLAPEVALRRFIENALGEDPPVELVDELFARRVANPPDPGRLAGTGGRWDDLPGCRRADHRTDADPRRHGRQRRRLSQRGSAGRRSAGRVRRAARRRRALVLLGAA
jgi:3-oxoadipate enol-lactonase